MQRVGARDWLLLALLSLLWGGSFFCYKVLDDGGLPPLTLVLGRVAIATAALLALMAMRRMTLRAFSTMWREFLILGLLNNVVPFFLFAYGEEHVASGLAAITNATTPMFTLLIAACVTRERLTLAKLIGVALGLIGVAIVVGPSVLRGFDPANLAQLACIGAAISYSVAVLYGRRVIADGMDAVTVTTGQLAASTVVVLPFALVLEHPWTLAMPSAATWGAWLVIGLVCSAAAYVLYFRLIATIGAVNASLVTLLVPVSALILGALALGERLGVAAFAGMAVIGFGLLVIDGRILRRLRRVPAATE